MTEWIAFRFSDDMPVEYRPPDLDGLWLPADSVPTAPSIEAARRMAKSPNTEHLVGEAVAIPTNRQERRMINIRPVELSPPWRVELISEMSILRLEDSGDFVTQTAQVWEIRPLWRVDEQREHPMPAP